VTAAAGDSAYGFHRALISRPETRSISFSSGTMPQLKFKLSEVVAEPRMSLPISPAVSSAVALAAVRPWFQGVLSMFSLLLC
jgi:hypothetical protein